MRPQKQTRYSECYRELKWLGSQYLKTYKRETSRKLKDLAVASHSRGNSWTKIDKEDFFSGSLEPSTKTSS
ncbi:hypothetical protein BpHYR1_010785 [Brachionus plicatilis]|uniref:Uncharacterized protein n=1 Tax=Brachionus plicatilis TaxID=10195 RepID=A0A3M7QVG9_BRAPC|nr:hypothetical protein BpHYR1_010785 [Brachionus plicatilis]